jgi:receptor protein-tyrosine kinase
MTDNGRGESPVEDQLALGTQFRQLLRVVAERWWIPLVFTVVLAAAAYLRASAETPKYQATATMVYAPQDASRALSGNPDFPSLQSAGSASDPTALNTVAKLVGTTLVRQRAVQRIGPISEPVSASIEPSTNLIEVSVVANDPKRAAAVANAWANAVAAARSDANRASLINGIRLVRQQLQAESRPGGDKHARQTLTRQLQTLQVASAVQQSDVHVVQPATVPTSRVSPTPVRDAVIGALAGLLLGILVLTAIEVLDRRLKTVHDAEEAWGAPLLASLPPSAPSMVGPEIADRATAEAFRHLQANLTFVGAAREARVVAVTSPVKAEGKTTTALGLAVTLASAGRPTILLDCDLRRRTVSSRLELGDVVGVSSLLAGVSETDDARHSVPVAVGKAQAASNGQRRTLDVIGSGPIPPNPFELFSSARLRALLDELRGRYDYVVLDCPPLLPVSDTVPIVAAVDGVLVAELLYVSRSDNAQRARAMIGRAGGIVLGLVIGAAKRAYDSGYGYGYGYGYGAEAEPEEHPAPEPAQPASLS